MKPLLTCSTAVRNNKQVHYIYVKIALRQQYGMKLYDQLKEKLTAEISKITERECKAFRHLMTYGKYKLSED